MRLVTDTFSYCAEHLPEWNTISISGYHIREAGSTAVQEIAFTLANGIAYVEAALAAGLEVDDFAPRLSFFWNAHNNLFEEVAKYRAARRMWARIMTERFGAKDERSKLLRFHTQTGGSTLTAQQPENNIVRVTAPGAWPPCSAGPRASTPTGSTRPSGLPTEQRGQDRAADPADRRLRVRDRRHRRPAGRLVVRRVAHRRGGEGRLGLPRADRRPSGGRWTAIEAQFMQERDRAGRLRLRQGGRRRREDRRRRQQVRRRRPEPTDVFPIDAELQRVAGRPGQAVRADRDQSAVDAALADVEAAARGTQNLLVPMKVALARMATLGEVSDVLREVFGVFQPAG